MECEPQSFGQPVGALSEPGERDIYQRLFFRKHEFEINPRRPRGELAVGTAGIVDSSCATMKCAFSSSPAKQ